MKSTDVNRNQGRPQPISLDLECDMIDFENRNLKSIIFNAKINVQL